MPDPPLHASLAQSCHLEEPLIFEEAMQFPDAEQ